jgi:hypothetical protein
VPAVRGPGPVPGGRLRDPFPADVAGQFAQLFHVAPGLACQADNVRDLFLSVPDRLGQTAGGGRQFPPQSVEPLADLTEGLLLGRP